MRANYMPQAADGKGQYSKKWLKQQQEKRPKNMTDEEFADLLEQQAKLDSEKENE